MLSSIREFARKNKFLREFIAFYLTPSGFFDKIIKNYKISGEWENRINKVLECPEFEKISTVTNAGIISNGTQIMHNGIKINLGSYYGPEYAILFEKTKGIHEPQEELIFSQVLKNIRKGGTMIELGSFWSFYSMWFNKEVKNAKNYMVEPESFNLKCGKNNFKLNGMEGFFTQALVGSYSGIVDGNKMISVDNFVDEKNIDFIDILHSDIQGFEYDMLVGAQKTVRQNKVGYIFISTHSNEIHYKCLKFLKENNFEIISSIDINQTYSEDGLIVAINNEIKNY